MSVKRTLLGLEVMHGGVDEIPEVKLITFLDYMRTEAIKRLGVPVNLVNAKMQTTVLDADKQNVPTARPIGHTSE